MWHPGSYFLDQGSNLCPLHWEHEAFTTDHQGGSPLTVIIIIQVHAQSLQSCMTLCDPMDSSPMGSSVHGILPARILEWVAMPSPGDLPQSRLNQHLLSLLHCRQFLYLPGKPHYHYIHCCYYYSFFFFGGSPIC